MSSVKNGNLTPWPAQVINAQQIKQKMKNAFLENHIFMEDNLMMTMKWLYWTCVALSFIEYNLVATPHPTHLSSL